MNKCMIGPIYAWCYSVLLHTMLVTLVLVAARDGTTKPVRSQSEKKKMDELL